MNNPRLSSKTLSAFCRDHCSSDWTNNDRFLMRLIRLKPPSVRQWCHLVLVGFLLGPMITAASCDRPAFANPLQVLQIGSIE
ncbi:hypothetical protein OAN00_04395, partial [Pseudomonadales bacterium]|nr:hypothetical protein [Pseudomonadales bacterium]